MPRSHRRRHKDRLAVASATRIVAPIPAPVCDTSISEEPTFSWREKLHHLMSDAMVHVMFLAVCLDIVVAGIYLLTAEKKVIPSNAVFIVDSIDYGGDVVNIGFNNGENSYSVSSFLSDGKDIDVGDSVCLQFTIDGLGRMKPVGIWRVNDAEPQGTTG